MRRRSHVAMHEPVSPTTAAAYAETGRVRAMRWDIAKENIPEAIPRAGVDVVTMIYVLSALRVEDMAGAMAKMAVALRPGGTLCLRDYGRYDLAQLRFKQGRRLEENFYVRGDGTQV